MRSSPGKIFLADERGLSTGPGYRRHSTFSFGDFAHPHKQPFGRLLACNEETLAGGQELALPVTQPVLVLLLPVTGTLAAGFAPGPAQLVKVEETQLLVLPAGSTLYLRNPHSADLISFLHLWISARQLPDQPAARTYGFDFANLRNCLTPVLSAGAAAGCSLHLGHFAGRQEALHTPRAVTSSVFVFVLAGAFEVLGRLLHAKDGLALWDAAAVDLEALSNDALVLLLELE